MRVRNGRVVAAAVIVAALAGCGSGHASSAAGTVGQEAAATAVPTLKLTPLQLCVSVVDNWLQMSIEATQEGYPMGVDATQLMERYGVESATYQAFEALDPVVLGYIEMHGPDGAYQDVASQTQQTCEEYGASAGQSAATPVQSPAVPAQSPVTSAALPSWTPSADPYSKGCPTSGQLLAAWNAAPASVRDSWVTGATPTGFFGTECWHQWVVTNPVIQANGSVVFTDTGGQLSLLPETDLSEFDAAICGVAGAPSASWAGPGGPATCS